MKKIIIGALFALIAVIIVLIAIVNPKNGPSVTINGKTFIVDVAKNELQREKGLSIYSNLPNERGMIFLFQTSGYYAFWMKDMKFPIDIIYLKNNKIVDMFENVPPPKSENEQLQVVKPREKADMVLEINAGLSNKYNFRLGDNVITNLGI